MTAKPKATFRLAIRTAEQDALMKLPKSFRVTDVRYGAYRGANLFVEVVANSRAKDADVVLFKMTWAEQIALYADCAAERGVREGAT